MREHHTNTRADVDDVSLIYCISQVWTNSCRLNMLMKARWRRRRAEMVMNWEGYHRLVSNAHTEIHTHTPMRKHTALFTAAMQELEGRLLRHLGERRITSVRVERKRGRTKN